MLDIFKTPFLRTKTISIVRIVFLLNFILFVPHTLIISMPELVHIMVWRRVSDKPLSEPMMAFSLSSIWGTRRG